MEEIVKDKEPEDYEGPAHHEKSIHKTHFTAPGVVLKKGKDDDEYEWVEIRPGRLRRYKKECDD
jgi:hypothetical protein